VLNDDIRHATNGPVVLVSVEASVANPDGVAAPEPNVSGRKAPRSLPNPPGNQLDDWLRISVVSRPTSRSWSKSSKPPATSVAGSPRRTAGQPSLSSRSKAKGCLDVWTS
jgi:hypothetical protein